DYIVGINSAPCNMNNSGLSKRKQKAKYGKLQYDAPLSSILLIFRWKTYVIESNLKERSCVAAK
ncbi:hypothetical protein ACKOTY_14980, partial [Legionella pneumophila]|uniref:hypothetical protein n=2 Tax=Gammaproteobacteria TaxID=1236 RepID=UPI003965B46B